MQQTLIDGVPVFLAHGPAPLTAGLVFGVGRADETFVRGGLTHLVEHLAMSAVGRTTYESNASVDLSRTEFTASGTPAQIRDFLSRVCAALSDLPLERLAVEADVLRTEGGAVAPGAVGGLLTELYGLVGPGLAGVREPALRSLTAEHVREWVRSWFVRENAALWLTGPVPEGLTLPLSDGAPPERRPLWRAGIPTPGWTAIPAEGGAVSLGAEMAPGIGGSVTLEILRRRVEDELRHRRGMAYSVAADRLPLDESTRFGVVVTDVRPGQEGLAAAVLRREVQRLASDGPTAEELEHERTVISEALDDPRSELDEVVAMAEAHVTGVPVYGSDELRHDLAALTVADVRAAAALLLEHGLLGVSEPLDPAPSGLERVPAWSADVVEGRQFTRRRLTGVPKGATLIVGEDGASVVLEEGALTVRWEEAVGLVRQSPGEYLLLGRDGFSIPVSVSDWRDGEEAVALIRGAVPEDLQVDDEAEDEGLLVLRAPAHRVAEALALGTYGATLHANGEWTVVRADGHRPTEEVAHDVASVAGRRTTGLVLRRTHADVEYTLLRGKKVVDRHRWGIAPGDAALLAEATDRRPDDMARLHAVQGAPDEVLSHVVAALGVPPEVSLLLLDGPAPEGGQRVEGQGIAGGTRASLRGDFAPPEGGGSAFDKYLALSRTRSAWFRAANVAAVVVYALVIWGALVVREYLDGWRFWLLLVFCVVGLLNAAWDSRPPRREADELIPEPDRAPTG